MLATCVETSDRFDQVRAADSLHLDEFGARTCFSLTGRRVATAPKTRTATARVGGPESERCARFARRSRRRRAGGGARGGTLDEKNGPPPASAAGRRRRRRGPALRRPALRGSRRRARCSHPAARLASCARHPGSRESINSKGNAEEPPCSVSCRRQATFRRRTADTNLRNGLGNVQ